MGDQLNVDPGSVYRILRLLEDAGMVASSWELSETGPPRRTYAVEPPGYGLLRCWAEIIGERGRALVRLAKLAEQRVTAGRGVEE